MATFRAFSMNRSSLRITMLIDLQTSVLTFSVV